MKHHAILMLGVAGSVISLYTALFIFILLRSIRNNWNETKTKKIVPLFSVRALIKVPMTIQKVCPSTFRNAEEERRI